MNSGGRSTAAVRCRNCRTYLTVPPGERAIQCTECYGVTRVRQCSSMLPVTRPAAAPTAFPCGRGKKRAAGRGCAALTGPINNVKFMRHLLCQRFGFPSDCIHMLTDDQKDPSRLPTKDNIRKAMRCLLQGCSNGESLVPDDDCDEVDGNDEAICPMDSFHKGPILDDEINKALVRPLVHGAKLHAVVDACHSATVLDLPFLCCRSRCGNWQWEDHRPPSGVCKGTSGGQAVLIAGYSDGRSKISATPEAYASVGAMTHSFIKALECEPRGLTYGRLLTSMEAIMTSSGGRCSLQGPVGAPVSKVANFSGVQEPNLSSSELFDVNCKPFAL
ncbi:hypothetical protein BS78_01G331800 [Paspalum vaginatum]|nr:hypothetical protein BS78_01G331800 [Paspalum vaginatum]